MAFSRRFSENFRTLSSAVSGNRMASNITRLIIHHTGGWPHNSVEDLTRVQNNPSDGSYHFLVETGINQHATGFDARDGRGAGRISLAHHWNFQVGHAGSNANNVNSIGIAVAGNYSTEHSGVVPPTNLNGNPGFRPQVERLLSQIIADCLISFPSISRINRIRTNHPTPFTSVEASGIMRHADVDARNPICPGVNLGVSAIINRAIRMANTHDDIEFIRGRGINVPPAASPAQYWGNVVARVDFPNIAQFINNLRTIPLRATNSNFNIANIQAPLAHLESRRVIGEPIGIWMNNLDVDPQLRQLIVNAANRVQ